MKIQEGLSRRGFLAAVAAAPLPAQSRKHVPIGILMYAVQRDLNADFTGTLAAG